MASVQSVARAFQVLEVLAIAPAGISEMARRAELPKSTVARIVATLEELDAVERTTDGNHYRIGSMVRRLAASSERTKNLIELVRPGLARLAKLTSEAAGFSIADGTRVHYVAQVDSDRSVQVRDWTGELIPLHLASSGLVLLAHWPAAALEDYLSGDLVSTTDRSVVDPAAIRDRLAEVREVGYCWMIEEFQEGIASVAAPVVDSGGWALGAIHIHGPSYRFPVSGCETLHGKQVVELARRLTQTEKRTHY